MILDFKHVCDRWQNNVEFTSMMQEIYDVWDFFLRYISYNVPGQNYSVKIIHWLHGLYIR